MVTVLTLLCPFNGEFDGWFSGGEGRGVGGMLKRTLRIEKKFSGKEEGHLLCGTLLGRGRDKLPI